MKLWKMLEKIDKELKLEVNGSKGKYIITVDHDQYICITRENSRQYFYIHIKDWEKIKDSIDNLLNKEV